MLCSIYFIYEKYTGGSQQKLPLLRIHNKISIDQMVGMTRKSITRHLTIGSRLINNIMTRDMHNIEKQKMAIDIAW